jgi:hypothetical protein
MPAAPVYTSAHGHSDFRPRSHPATPARSLAGEQAGLHAAPRRPATPARCPEAQARRDGHHHRRRLRPSPARGKRGRRRHDRAERHRPPDQAPAPLDEADARGRGLALPAGARAGAPGAGRRGRGDRAVELPGQPLADSAGHGDRRRQPRLPEAVRTHPEDQPVPARTVGRGVPARPRRRGDRRCRHRRGLRRPAVRPPGVHRLHRGRPQGDGRGGAEPDAAHPGAGRQVAGADLPTTTRSNAPPRASPPASGSTAGRPASPPTTCWCRRASATRW